MDWTASITPAIVLAALALIWRMNTHMESRIREDVRQSIETLRQEVHALRDDLGSRIDRLNERLDRYLEGHPD